jgi:hypothetical protein
VSVLANVGLTSQLVVLGICLALGRRALSLVRSRLPRGARAAPGAGGSPRASCSQYAPRRVRRWPFMDEASSEHR